MSEQANATQTVDPKKKIRGELLARKGLTVSDFAVKHGFNIKTVEKVIKRYAGTGKAPRGAESAAIMARLTDELGASVVSEAV